MPVAVWFHFVAVYLGRHEGEGIVMYIDGHEAGRDEDTMGGPNTPGDGVLVIGRFDPSSNTRYCSVEMDDLIFWNEALQEADIMNPYNM